MFVSGLYFSLWNNLGQNRYKYTTFQTGANKMLLICLTDSYILDKLMLGYDHNGPKLPVSAPSSV